MRTDRTRPTTEQAEARLLADIAAAKASHTRGPWHAGETVYRDGVAIISIIDDSDSPHDIIRNGETSLIHNADANARLIAAAPDLLAALQAFYKWWGSIDCICLNPEPIPNALGEQMEAAIAKATNPKP